MKSIPITLTSSRKQTQVAKEQINLHAVEAKESLRIVKCYSMRWKIESYFRVLKSGCTVEDARLGDASRMIDYIALNSVISWRFFWMTFITRTDPKISCEVALTESEWQALYCYYKEKSKVPKKPPSIKEVIIWLARLGGFLARKSDGEPGPTYLWRGWSRLQDMAHMRRILINS